jgi:glycosyltransferase involved in cell wall biosynthesis
MKAELLRDFGVPATKVSVVPFGINNTVPNTAFTSAEAKHKLAVRSTDKIILFFGNIAPYKGLEYLVSAFSELLKKDGSYRLVIVGRPKGSENYWDEIERVIVQTGLRGRTIETIEYIPDEETELYFKAADVLVLPYTRIFQSGVLFLGYSFGLPAIAADVGTLRQEIVEGETGFVFKAQDSVDLARAITKYFASELYQNLEARRAKIKKYANERYAWDKVAVITTSVYSNLLSSAPRL